MVSQVKHIMDTRMICGLDPSWALCPPPCQSVNGQMTTYVGQATNEYAPLVRIADQSKTYTFCSTRDRSITPELKLANTISFEESFDLTGFSHSTVSVFWFVSNINSKSKGLYIRVQHPRSMIYICIRVLAACSRSIDGW